MHAVFQLRSDKRYIKLFFGPEFREEKSFLSWQSQNAVARLYSMHAMSDIVMLYCMQLHNECPLYIHACKYILRLR